MINTFYKDHLEKLTITLPPKNSAPSMPKLTTKLSTKPLSGTKKKRVTTSNPSFKQIREAYIFLKYCAFAGPKSKYCVKTVDLEERY